MLLGMAAAAALAALSACGDVGYNPYVRNDDHKPIGKVLDDGHDAVQNACDEADRRFENLFY